MSNNGKTVNVLNVKKRMKETTGVRVSPEAVQELLSRFDDWLVDNMPGVEEIACRHGRKTIYDADIVEYCSVIGNGVLEDE